MQATEPNKRAVPPGYAGIPDGSENSVYLTMEEEAFARFRQRAVSRSPEECRLFSRAGVSRRVHADGTVQLFYLWHDLLWREEDPAVAAFTQGLADVTEPYQLVRLGEEFGQIAHVYGNGFDDTDLDGFEIVQSMIW